MKTFAWCLLGGTIALLLAYTFALPHEPPKLKRLRRLYRKDLRFTDPVPDARSSIEQHRRILGSMR